MTEFEQTVDTVKLTLHSARWAKRHCKDPAARRRLAAAILCLEDALARLTDDPRATSERSPPPLRVEASP